MLTLQTNSFKVLGILVAMIAIGACNFKALNLNTAENPKLLELSSPDAMLTYSINGSTPSPWRVAPEINPDELSVECSTGDITRVEFRSKTGAIQFELSGKGREDFVVELDDGRRANTRIQCIPRRLRFRGDYASGNLQDRDFHRDLNSGTLDEHIQQIVEVRKIPGVSLVVVKDQVVLFQQSYGVSDKKTGAPIGDRTPMRLASATKFVSGLVFLSLAEDGIIDLEKTLGDYLPGLRPDWRPIPLWRLLNHTSGLPTLQATALRALPHEEMDLLTPEDIFNTLKDLPLDFEPGSRGRYQQEAYAILAHIGKLETGLSWAQLVQQHVFIPAGMNDAYYGDSLGKHPLAYTYASGDVVSEEYYYPSGIHMSGGLNLSTNDASGLFKALASDKIVSRSFYESAVFSQSRLAEPTGYSLAAIVNMDGDMRTVGHEGGAGAANIRYAPESKIGVAVFTNLNSQSAAQDITAEIIELLFDPVNFIEENEHIVSED